MRQQHFFPVSLEKHKRTGPENIRACPAIYLFC
jgi:hypothetical protein